MWHCTFRRRRLATYVAHFGTPVNHIATKPSENGKLLVLLGTDDAVLNWWTVPGLAPVSVAQWSLPYTIKAVAFIPTIGWAVAFGDEVAVFHHSE
jgi:hypothetical protein